MADDIDTEEHGVMFPDLSIVKEEFDIIVYDMEYELEASSPQPSTSAGADDVIPDSTTNMRREHGAACEMTRAADSPHMVTSTQEGAAPPPVSNCIILGSKPTANCIIVGSRPTASPPIDYQHYTSATVPLIDWSHFLRDSRTYCRDCRTLFATVNALDAHKMHAHSFNREQKAVPPVTVRESDPSPELPTRVRESDSIFKKCEICLKTFSDEKQLITHIYDHTNTSVQCDRCPETFFSQQKLEDHKLVHSSEAAQLFYRCHICGLYSSDRTLYERHYLKRHNTVPDNYEMRQLDLTCPHCRGGVLSNFNRFQSHIRKKHQSQFHLKVNPGFVTKPRAKLTRPKPCNTETTEASNSNKEDGQLNLDDDSVVVPKRTLFRCTKCDVHFLNILIAVSHYNSCSGEMVDTYRCVRCKLHLKLSCQTAHHNQHKFEDKFTALEISDEDIRPRILARCPRCAVHYSVQTLSSHVEKCASKQANRFRCQECRLRLDERLRRSHEFSHQNLKYEANDFITIDYRELRSMKRYKFYYCKTCKCFINFRTMIVSHMKGLCRNYRRNACPICGLTLPARSLGTHRRLHGELENYNLENFKFYNLDDRKPMRQLPEYAEETSPKYIAMYYCNICNSYLHKKFHRSNLGNCKLVTKYLCSICGLVCCSRDCHHQLHRDLNIKLHDITFYSIPDLKLIKPPAPKYQQCTKCRVHCTMLRSEKHKCHQENSIKCRICNISLSKRAYKLHMPFHSYTNSTKKSKGDPPVPKLFLKRDQLDKNLKIVPISSKRPGPSKDIVDEKNTRFIEKSPDHDSNQTDKRGIETSRTYSTRRVTRQTHHNDASIQKMTRPEILVIPFGEKHPETTDQEDSVNEEEQTAEEMEVDEQITDQNQTKVDEQVIDQNQTNINKQVTDQNEAKVDAPVIDQNQTKINEQVTRASTKRGIETSRTYSTRRATRQTHNNDASIQKMTRPEILVIPFGEKHPETTDQEDSVNEEEQTAEEMEVDEQITGQNQTKVDEQVIDQNQTNINKQVTDQNEAKVDVPVIDQNQTQINEEVIDQNQTKVDEQVIDQNQTNINEQVTDQNQTKVDRQVTDQNRTRIEEQVTDQNQAKVDEQVIDQNQTNINEQVTDQNQTKVDRQVTDQNRTRIEEQVTDQNQAKVDEQVIDQNQTKVDEQIIDQNQTKINEQVTDQNQTKVDEQIIYQNQTKINEQVTDQNQTKVDDQVIYQNQTKINDQVTDQNQTKVDEQVIDQNQTKINEKVTDQNQTKINEQITDQNQTKIDEQVIDQNQTKVDEQVTDQNQTKDTARATLYLCKPCGVHLMTARSVAEHALTPHRRPTCTFPCPKCGLRIIRNHATYHRKLYHENPYYNLEDFIIKDIRGLNPSEIKKIWRKQKALTVKRTRDGNAVTSAKECEKKVYYKCKNCNVVFLSKKQCVAHFKSHVRIPDHDFVACKICGKNFLVDSLRDHMSHHKMLELTETNLLTMIYSTEYQPNENGVTEETNKFLSRDLNVDKDDDMSDGSDVSNGHACELCTKKYRTRCARDLHVNLDHMDELMECPICSNTFHKSVLNYLHLCVRDGTFKCCVCGISYPIEWQSAHAHDYTTAQAKQ